MNKKFLILSILILSLIFFPLTSVGNHSRVDSTEISQTFRVQLLAINDFHGQLSYPLNVNGTLAGGAPVLDAYINAAIIKEPNSFIIDAGDLVGASALSSAILQDEPTIEFFNQLGNRWCGYGEEKMADQANIIGIPGNHEFDCGLKEQHRLFNGGNNGNLSFDNDWKGAKFPLICCNIHFRDSDSLLFPPYIIKHVNGIPIAFIGATTKETPIICKNPDMLKIKFFDEASAINAFIPEIKKKGVKAIIAIIHDGGAQKFYSGTTNPSSSGLKGSIVSTLEKLNPEIDVVITGHTHSFTNIIYTTTKGNSFLVTQSLPKGTAFTDIILDISKTSGDVIAKSASIIPTYCNQGPAKRTDYRIEKFKKIVDAKTSPLINKNICSTSCDISKIQNSAGESPMGNLIADADRYCSGTDFTFINESNIRGGLKAGPISWGKLYFIQPFNNRLVKMILTGQDIFDLLNEQWLNHPSSPYFLQISGLTYSWSPNASDSCHIVEIYKDNIPIDRNKYYSISAPEFLSDGGDNFTVLKRGLEKTYGITDLEALNRYLKSFSQSYKISNENRIIKIEN